MTVVCVVLAEGRPCGKLAEASLLSDCPRGHMVAVDHCPWHAYMADQGLAHCAACGTDRQTTRLRVIARWPVEAHA